MLWRMTGEQQLIFDWIGNLPVLVPNWEKRLPMLYEELNATWFDGTLPELTDTFVCEFCDMPQDSAGIFIDAETAAMRSTPDIKIRPGIRINSALRALRDHVKIALLHEMVHVSGIMGHLEPFHLEISRLMLAGAYNGLL
jgi:hypothetical protein